MNKNLSKQSKMSLARILLVSLSCCLTLVSGNGHAEDVEIYTNAAFSDDVDVDAKSNVLMILDNSGSMNSNFEPDFEGFLAQLNPPDSGCVEGSGPSVSDAYDPSIDYGPSLETSVYFYRDGAYTGSYMNDSQNYCDAIRTKIENNSTTPWITGKVAQWRDYIGERCINFGPFGDFCFAATNYRWFGGLNDFESGVSASKVECNNDRNKHGATDGSSLTYARWFDRYTSSTPSFTTRGDRNTGNNPYPGSSNYTWYAGNYHDYLRFVDGEISGPNPESCPTYGDNSTYTGLPEFTTLDRSLCNNDDVIDNDRRFIITGDSPKVYQCKRRFTIMKEAVDDLLAGLENVNVGIMQFNYNAWKDGEGCYSAYSSGCPQAGVGKDNGGTVIKAITDIDAAGNKDTLRQIVKDMEIELFTPISEAYYEAALYYRGKSRYSGRTGSGTGTTDSNAISGSGVYTPPSMDQCQSNSIVLLSDGAPTNDEHYRDVFRQRNGKSNIFGKDLGCDTDCAVEIANELYTTDNDSSDDNFVDKIKTFTVGFNTSDAANDVLKEIAAAGQPESSDSANPGFQTAETSAQLLTVLRSFLAETIEIDGDVFSAPAVTVNAYNRLQNREDIYYALFRPEGNPRWTGNVKKYRVGADATILDNSTPPRSAITDNGFFDPLAKSFWSTEIDGPAVAAGGAGEHIGFPRRLYGKTSSGAGNGNLDVQYLSDSGVTQAITNFLSKTVGNPTGAINIGALNTGDTDITGIADLGISGLISTYGRNAVFLAAWNLGLDVDNSSGGNQANNYVGDSLHSTPYVLSYGPSADNPQDVVFYTSNQGMLHAIDGQTGAELWAYVPDASLMQNLGNYYNRTGTGKLYGLDGEIAFDVNRSSGTMSSATLYFGQRRGGNKVFAVDVTNARAQSGERFSHVWTIEGGSGDFDRLGQTWAEPVVASVELCDYPTSGSCGARDVLFISGGYDTYFDDDSNQVKFQTGENTLGNAVYMVDAATGKMLWKVSGDVASADRERDLYLPEMRYSVPSKPTVLDVDGNGASDTLIFTDVAGQIFRVDFRAHIEDTDDISYTDNSNSKSITASDGTSTEIDSVSGGVIADLSVAGIKRRFYNSVDVTLLPSVLNADGSEAAPVRYALTTGSGYRAHPLEEESFGNRLYVIYENNVVAPKFDDAGDATYEYKGSGNSASTISSSDIGSSFTQSGYGFYFAMPTSGEKIISPTLISDFKVLTVSYIPAEFVTNNQTTSCVAGLGASVAYSFDLLNGNQIVQPLQKQGITAAPVVVYVLDEEDVNNVCQSDCGPDDPDSPDPDTEETIKPIVIIGTEPFEGDQFGLSNLNLGKAEKKVWWEQGRGR